MVGLFSALLIPLRSHVPPASIALILVVPLVTSIAIGGISAGIIVTIAGFGAYDLFFIPPYGTLAVGTASNWIPLGVYALVGLITVLIDRRFRLQRERALYQARILERLASLPATLISEHSLERVWRTATEKIVNLLDLEGAMALRPEGNILRPANIVGDQEIADTVARVFIGSNGMARSGSITIDTHVVQSFALSTLNDNFGFLVIWNDELPDVLVQALNVVASQISAALERTQLRETRLKLDTLEEIDSWRVSLLRTVSHDLLTPLAGIKTATTALNEFGDSLDANERTQLIDTALAQIDRSIQLVSDLLNVTRIEAGAFHLQYQDANLIDIIQQVAVGIDFLSVSSKLDLTAPPDLPLVRVDVGLLREVIWNLLDNAVRHSPIGEAVRVNVILQHDLFTVHIYDAGRIVEGVDQVRLFDWFHTAGASGRSGLGLAIARSFIEAHHGRLSVNASNTGTTFTFTLPSTP
jgi:two-component system sensor histidine kinase KdpD